MFLDESSDVVRKAQASGVRSHQEGFSISQANLRVPQVCSREVSFRSVSPPNRTLLPPLEDQATAFFFANYANWGPYYSTGLAGYSALIYQEDEPDGPVKTIVRAVGLGGLSRIAKDMRMRNAAIANYVSAISKTNEHLRHPVKARADTTLFSIISLAVFEV
jgi:hypothetical protein